MQMQVLTSLPDGYGNHTSPLPESILTRSAPALDLKLVPVAGIVIVAVYVWFEGAWAKHEFGTFTTYAYESVAPVYHRLGISASVEYACIVVEGGTGSVEAYLEETWANAGGAQVALAPPVALSPAAIIRWQSFVAYEGQRTFTISEAASAFVLVFYGEKPLFEVNGGFSVNGRSITLAGSAWAGTVVMVGYQPAVLGG